MCQLEIIQLTLDLGPMTKISEPRKALAKEFRRILHHRRELGPLRRLILSKQSRRRYARAFLSFVRFVRRHIPRDVVELDESVCDRIEHLWMTGRL